SEQKFEISPDQAVMSAAEERRGFDEHEGATLQRLLDVLSMYCAESVVWWDQGQGMPLDPVPGSAKPAPKKSGEDKPVKIQEKPAYRIPEGNLVAAVAAMRW